MTNEDGVDGGKEGKRNRRSLGSYEIETRKRLLREVGGTYEPFEDELKILD